MAVDCSQNEVISGGGKNGKGKGVGFVNCQGKAKRRSINIKKRKRGGVV